MANEKSIKVYRAIWGKAREGVSDEELRRNGMFTRNYWAEGHNSGYVDTDLEEKYKLDPALPVYLYKEQPLGAIVGITDGVNGPMRWKQYKKDTGVMAEAGIPYSLLFGSDAKLKITRDMVRGTHEVPRYEVTEEMVNQFNSGELSNHGEFSIRPRDGVSPEEYRQLVRSLEHLYRPKVNQEGQVISEELEVVSLPPEPDEINTEVSRL